MMPETFELHQGMILPGSIIGNLIGFTQDKFTPWSYLWKINNSVYFSFICAMNPGSGDYRALCEKIISLGCTIKIPTPFPRMREICKKQGYGQTYENTDDFGQCEVWVKKHDDLSRSG